MLREGLKMSPDEGQEELEEVQAELKKKDEEVSQSAVKYLDQKGTQLLRVKWLRGFLLLIHMWCVGHTDVACCAVV